MIEGLSDGGRQPYRQFRNAGHTGSIPVGQRPGTGRREPLYVALIEHQCQ